MSAKPKAKSDAYYEVYHRGIQLERELKQYDSNLKQISGLLHEMVRDADACITNKDMMPHERIQEIGHRLDETILNLRMYSKFGEARTLEILQRDMKSDEEKLALEQQGNDK